MIQPRIWIALAALSGALGVGLGAFHAHGLEKWLERSGVDQAGVSIRMRNCETAVRYQLFHAPVILAIGIWSIHGRSRLKDLAAILYLAGTVMFSGGLYLLVFTGKLGHWSIVPLGGLSFILAWIVLGVAGRSEK